MGRLWLTRKGNYILNSDGELRMPHNEQNKAKSSFDSIDSDDAALLLRALGNTTRWKLPDKTKDYLDITVCLVNVG